MSAAGALLALHERSAIDSVKRRSDDDASMRDLGTFHLLFCTLKRCWWRQ